MNASVEDSIEYELGAVKRMHDEVRVDMPDSHQYNVRVKSRQRTPDLAVQNFDGTFDTVHAREVRVRFCNRALFNFVMSAAIVIAALITCLVLLAVRGFDSPGASWLQTMASFCLGVFLPNPHIKKNK